MMQLPLGSHLASDSKADRVGVEVWGEDKPLALKCTRIDLTTACTGLTIIFLLCSRGFAVGDAGR
jgi:hypothetical protein